ncbi:MAG TPA: hypothetical protein PKD72_06270 [Gemmatales bacterium]|nr:hypothetical protein [Gemmatales bacterium]
MSEMKEQSSTSDTSSGDKPRGAFDGKITGSPEAVLEQLASTETQSSEVINQPENNIALPSATCSVESMSPRVAASPVVRRGLPFSLWLTALLVPYAIGSTIGMAYLFNQLQRNKQPHILESIPDQGLYEDFFDGRRASSQPDISKASQKPGSTKIIPPQEPLSDAIPPIPLGETRTVGMLKITPKQVSVEKLHYRYKQGSRDVPGDEALVLTLEVSNLGNLIFHPDDVTFNRAYANEGKAPVYTYLELDKKRYYGAVVDPSTEQLNFEQPSPLLPGQSAAIRVVAYRASDGVTSAVAAWKKGARGVWRVHLRKGKEEITMMSGKKRQVWVTTVVPVEVKSLP